MVVRNFKDLGVWKKFIKLSVKIYGFSYDFLKSKQFGLTNQILGASFSAPANITGRFVGTTTKGNRRFYYVAYGFLKTKNFAHLSKDFKYLNQPRLDKLLSESKRF
ncbi:four helix bundle protein [Candidatus Saccharibacteria bacterium]|nr:four helix bundle protein [Candidatus Saccharibacteria bacterium]HPW48014.1 four helix bundle protein [Candidatus Saccharibacteria bacterium]